MDPITMAGTAVTIARACGMDDWLKEKFGGTPSGKAARRMIELAQAATGAGSPEEIELRIRNDVEAKMDARRELQRHEQELTQLHLADVRDARAMYGSSKSDMADRLANRIMSWNLPAIVTLVAGNCAVVYTIENPTIAVALGNIIGASITYLWQERQQVVGFFFGSSVGSKDKQDLLRGRA